MRSSCCLLLAAALAACATEGDERPMTFESVTFNVLKPTCGQVQCHSTTTWTKDYAFDTLAAARYTLCYTDVDVINVIDGVNGLEQMPPDAPLADKDEALIKNWFDAGRPGLLPCNQ